MKKNMTYVILFLAALQSSACKPIHFVPTIINRSGIYCLTKDVTISDVSSAAIYIDANNVTVDLGNHIISGPDKSQSRASGIESYHYNNIEIRNGIIKNFMYGVRIQDTDLEKLRNDSIDAMHDVTINKIRFESNTFRGVMIQAKKVTVKNSTFQSTGGTSVFPDSFSMAIESSGQDCIIKNNVIRDFYPVGTGEGVGISISSFGDGCQIKDNAITNVLTSKMGRTFGIWIGSPLSRNVIVSGNTITNMSYATNKPQQSDFSNNTYNNTHCADYFGNKKYYLEKEPCYEENTAYFFTQANLGNARYLFKLAVQYLEGMWVDADLDTSKHYFTLASELGHEESKRILKNKWG